MFCQKCSLHYPEHLSFCRRCGQTLVHSNAETSIESQCCTRCGARVIRGENFCQHCGNRVSVALQETVIGACYHCGTSWRSGWIYCKNCGLDRKRALLLSTSTPSPGGANSGISQQLEEFPELSKINCKSCGAEAKPYSKFCEACGANLVGSSRNKAESVPSAVTTKDQPDPQSQKSNQRDPVYQTSPTIFEPRSASESERNLSNEELRKFDLPNNGSENSASLPPNATINSAKNAPADGTTWPADFKTAGTLETPLTENSIAEPEANGSQAKTVVTPLPPFGGEFRSKGVRALPVSNKPNRRKTIQSIVFIGFAFLLVLLIVWWFKRDSLSEIFSFSGRIQSSTQTGTTGTNVGSTPNSANGALADMVYVSGGKMEMGRDGGDEYETPVHSVIVNSFYMDRTEVTNEQYQLFVAQTGHRAPIHWRDGKFPSGETKLPVVNVSWDDANAYAKWIGKRLPTEAEWEFAARGSDGRIYPWGNSWNATNANAGKESGGAIAQVGSFPHGASQFGILDMCGNVWEWTSSSLNNYADETKEIAPGKVIRGGAFDTPSKRATATYRGVLPSDRLRDKTGFRLVKDAK
ncbi:MAG: SUMF1/EgtB/PvdO family nonheme iron enzyme [Acidobacteria bacterium]|nr:SUMF1/EgtB/PvdO family nonheme iron enzyme [Acidobacteriota bacterium]